MRYSMRKTEQYSEATSVKVAGRLIPVYILSQEAFEEVFEETEIYKLAYTLYKIRAQDKARRELTQILIKKAIEAGLTE